MRPQLTHCILLLSLFSVSIKIRANTSKPCEYLINIENVLIRCATIEDADSILPLMHQLVGFPQSLKSLENRLKIYLTSPGYHLFLAEMDKNIVGLVAVFLSHRFIVYGKRCTIEALVVDEFCRGWGIGHKLMDVVELFAKDSGCTLIDLVSGIQRTQTHTFYTKLGYRDTGPHKKLYFTKRI